MTHGPLERFRVEVVDSRHPVTRAASRRSSSPMSSIRRSPTRGACIYCCGAARTRERSPPRDGCGSRAGPGLPPCQWPHPRGTASSDVPETPAQCRALVPPGRRFRADAVNRHVSFDSSTVGKPDSRKIATVNDELDRDKKGAYDRKSLVQHGYTKFPACAMHLSHRQIRASRHSQASDRTSTFVCRRGMDLTGRRRRRRRDEANPFYCLRHSRIAAVAVDSTPTNGSSRGECLRLRSCSTVRSVSTPKATRFRRP